jgi:hypothetical protein
MILTLLCIALAVEPIYQERSGRVDTVMVRMVDLTGDGKSESVELRITARSFHAPFKWTLTIRSGKTNLYTFTVNNGLSLEERFQHQAASGNVSYDTIKHRFFFRDFCEFTTGTGLPEFDTAVYVDSTYSDGSVYAVARRALGRMGLAGPALSTAVNALALRIRDNRAVMFSHSDGNVDVTQPMAYVPEVRAFVPVYSW